jgi:hypothetical protein
LSDADARQLFERFGRQLYAIVSYQVRAANDGSRQIQIVATDGQLFGLSSDAVVRVQSYAHPSMSQPSYLDISNPLDLEFSDLLTKMTLQFQQQGFRAVGSGTRSGRGTDFSAARDMPVTGSGAVGNSGFILRLSSPEMLAQINENAHELRQLKGTVGYLTVYGSVDFERVTAEAAPVSGVYVVQTINPQTGLLEGTRPLRFTGQFRAPGAPGAQAEPSATASQLDELVIDTPAEPANDEAAEANVPAE